MLAEILVIYRLRQRACEWHPEYRKHVTIFAVFIFPQIVQKPFGRFRPKSNLQKVATERIDCHENQLDLIITLPGNEAGFLIKFMRTYGHTKNEPFHKNNVQVKQDTSKRKEIVRILTLKFGNIVSGSRTARVIEARF